MFIRLIEVILIVFFLSALVSQIIIPAMMGTNLFPWFNKQSKLEAKIADARQEQYNQKLIEEEKRIKRATKAARSVK